jgi:hypothetical protein
VKRSEPRWVAIHIHNGSSARNLSVLLFLSQSSKMLCLCYYLLCFLFNKIGEQEGRTGSAWMQRVVRREVAQTMYTHMSKCKNDKMKN